MALKALFSKPMIQEEQDRLESAISTYVETKENTNDKCDDEAFFSSFHDLLKALMENHFVIPCELEIYDNKLKSDLRKGRVESIPLDNERVKITPVAVEIKRGEEYAAQRIGVFSSFEKAASVDTAEMFLVYSFSELYEKYLRDNETSDGIIVNPSSNNIEIPLFICEMMANGLKEEDWNEFIQETVESIDGSSEA